MAAPARANDTTANLAAGGLVFAKSDAIAMKSEDLSISMDEVAVRYVFVNESPTPVTTTVAFPMPDIRIDPYDGNVAIPSDDPDNPLDFHTLVDGEPVAMQLAQTVTANGRDVTALLKRLGLPLAPQSQEARSRLDALGAADKAAVLAAGIAVTDEYDAGRGWESHLAPDWTLHAVYHWRQTFPPGRPILIEHRYKPSVGGSVGTALGQSWDDPQEVAALRRRSCLDDDFMRTVQRRTRKAGPDTIAFQERWIDYVLVTGANWAGPIEDFRLVVDKGEPANLVSLCASGVKKIAPTPFEVRKRGFVPTDDLHILILVPAPG